MTFVLLYRLTFEIAVTAKMLVALIEVVKKPGHHLQPRYGYDGKEIERSRRSSLWKTSHSGEQTLSETDVLHSEMKVHCKSVFYYIYSKYV